MTRLTIAEDSGEEFTIRGYNTMADENDDEIGFYAEMDFADADSVRKSAVLEQMPSRPDERPSENLPDTQKH
jgi:hypothetical protein